MTFIFNSNAFVFPFREIRLDISISSRSPRLIYLFFLHSVLFSLLSTVDVVKTVDGFGQTSKLGALSQSAHIRKWRNCVSLSQIAFGLNCELRHRENSVNICTLPWLSSVNRWHVSSATLPSQSGDLSLCRYSKFYAVFCASCTSQPKP